MGGVGSPVSTTCARANRLLRVSVSVISKCDCGTYINRRNKKSSTTESWAFTVTALRSFSDKNDVVSVGCRCGQSTCGLQMNFLNGPDPIDP